jgi:hypothetical protein
LNSDIKCQSCGAPLSRRSSWIVSLAAQFVAPISFVGVLVATFYFGPWMPLAAFALLLIALLIVDERTTKWIAVDDR